MKSRTLTIVMAAWLIALNCPKAPALVQFNDGGVHDIDYQVDTDVWVDYDAPGMQTTVNLLPGGSLSNDYSLTAYNDGLVNVSGGMIGGELFAYDSSTVTVSGGSIGSYLRAYENSSVTVSGGSIYYLYAYEGSTGTVSGGSINYLYASGSSRVTVSGGSIYSNLAASGSSSVAVSGGSIGGNLHVPDNSLLTIHGSDFAVDGVPFGYGELTSLLGGSSGDEPARRLTGILADGSPIDSDFYIGYHGRITLVPEPATVLLLGLGGLAVIRRKR